MNEYNKKISTLEDLIDDYTNKDVVIAFSGGVDSSLLLELLCQYADKKNTKVYAVTVHTELHPMSDIDIAKKVAENTGAIHSIINIDELKDAGISNNPIDRCYLCKKYLFSQLKKFADNLHIDTIIDGTNEDDLHVYRPGIKALKELGIKSPLAASRLTKSEIRKKSAELGISVANRPSTPCLATRFPYDTPLSYDAMVRVENGEKFIRDLGAYNVRIRIHEDIARIEVDENDIDIILKNKKEIIDHLKSLGYIYITLDLEGFRSGSMDYKIKK